LKTDPVQGHSPSTKRVCRSAQARARSVERREAASVSDGFQSVADGGSP
jgi:hypothetical protein